MREFASPHPLAKVPEITLGFWIIKILATTLGETAGDSITMSWLGETTPQAGTDWFRPASRARRCFGRCSS